MKRIVHIGDEHLGGAYPEKAAKSFEFLIDQLWRDETSPAFNPDLVVSTGDLTDRPLHVHSEHLRPFLSFVKEAQCPIVLVQGTPSHEPIGAINNIAAVSDGRLIILGDVMDGALSNGIDVRALPALTRPLLAKWMKALAPNVGIDAFDDPNMAIKFLLAGIGAQWSQADMPRLLLGHWTVSGCYTATGQVMTGNDLEVSLEDLGKCGADAVLLGHIHKTQEWTSPIFTSYCGSIYPNNWGERDIKSFSVLEFDGRIMTSFLRIPFPHKPMVKIDIEFSADMTTDIEQLGDIADLFDKEVKVVYTIPREIAATIDDSFVRTFFAKQGVDLAVLERVIKTETRERIEGISAIQTTAEQYRAVCEARGVEVRPGAIIKANALDEVGVGQ